MAIFSTNSVRHLFVANATGSATTPGNFGSVSKTSDNELYFKFTNALGQEVRTDLIPANRIVKATVKNNKAKVLRTDTITFDTPVVGQTYTLRIVFRAWGSGSSENQYVKNVGSYRAKVGDTSTTLATALKASADINFLREAVPLMTFAVVGATLVVTEVAQPWVQGKQQGRPLDYYIQYVRINDISGSENVTWGQSVKTTSYPGLGTGHLAADMEYFYLGERGDKYRQVGYPYTFDTTYLVNPSQTYDIIDIVYNSGNSDAIGATNAEKVLTILANAGAGATHTIADAIIAAVTAANGAVAVLPARS